MRTVCFPIPRHRQRKCKAPVSYTHLDVYKRQVVQPQEQPWADVADLNFDNEIMQQAMSDAMKYWVTEIGIDGYRWDYAEGVPDAFWKKAIARCV